ncbi:hypothetical protein CL621_04205 [archaeon]|nr:hypothetical protein [archaeon]|tara:strand:+ start:1853 stop:3031 length:1179 start_codon:yes stop_codon:yes gene_type:complete
MKIAMVIPDFPPIMGGGEIFAYEIAKRLAEKHEIHVITRLPTKAHFNRNNTSYQKLLAYEFSENIHIHRVKFFDVKDIRLFSSIFPMYFKLLQVIKKYKIDLIHGVMIFPAAQICALAKIKTKNTFFLTLQGFIIDIVREDKTIFDLYLGLLKPLAKFGIKKADFVHCVSNNVMRKALEFYRTNKIKIIPNGVDTKLFSPDIKTNIRERFNIKKDEILVATVSRLAPKNGIEYLVKAAKQISQKQKNIKFLIVGGGPLKEKLKDLSSGFEKNIIFTGNIPHDETPKFLAASDIFVRPSITEGFGISFVEAMSCGLPIITTEAVGKLKILRDREHGFIIKSKNVDELVIALNKLIQNKSLRNEFGEKARKYAIKHYDWNIVVEEIEKEMLKLI